MSNLPAALAARLAKRGILGKQNQAPQPSRENQHENEEVIAEDYDDDTEPTHVVQPIIKYKSIPTTIKCPHKYNVYHNCTTFCEKTYADVPADPTPELRKIFRKLVKKYPLPSTDWEQIYDPGVKTFYFWNVKTDQVSWLPPSHPKAKPSLAAEKVRNLLRESNKDDDSCDSNESDSSDDSESSDESESSSSEDESSASAPPPPKRIARIPQNPHQRKPRDAVKRNDLDPMDPSAYSNAPRGKWSSGLNNKDADLL